MQIDSAQPIRSFSDQSNLHHVARALQGAPSKQLLEVSVAARLIDGSAPPKAPAADGHISVRA